MNTIKRLFSYIKPFKVNLGLSIVSAFLGILFSLTVPVLIGYAVDCLLGTGNVAFDKLFKILILLSISIILSALFQWLMNFHSNKLSYKTVEKLRTELDEKLMHLPLSYLDKTADGDLIHTVTTDIDIIASGLLQGFTQVLSGIVTILGTLIFMFYIHPYPALVVVILTPLSFFVASFIARHAHKNYVKQAKMRGEISGYATEMIEGASTLRAFNGEHDSYQTFKKMNEEMRPVGVIAHFYSALTNPCTRFVNALVYAVVAIFGAVLAVNSVLTVGTLTSFLTYCTQYTKPFNEISGVIAEFQNALASADRVFALLDKQNEPVDSCLPDFQYEDGDVSLQEVKFSYTRNTKLIENFNLKAKSNQTIAIVGPTGCGKTTLINLLMRFYDLDSGCIEIDGQSVSAVNRDSLRRCFGMVLQDTWLFSGTIAENIAYGKPNASREEIIEAAKAAHAHSFIKRLENGYDTKIAENSENLSEGQKQLLCIARVMLLKPPMLILDEATSSIDTRTELRIQKALKKLMDGRTSFIVAHRLSTIQNADVIVVMRNGQIVETGTHKELLAKNGFYKELYNSQFAVY